MSEVVLVRLTKDGESLESEAFSEIGPAYEWAIRKGLELIDFDENADAKTEYEMWKRGSTKTEDYAVALWNHLDADGTYSIDVETREVDKAKASPDSPTVAPPSIDVGKVEDAWGDWS